MSQTEIDSLKKVTLYEQNDTIRANNYEYISWLYYRVNTDSSLKYAQKSYYLAKGLEDRILQSIALKHMGRSHSLKGNYNIAMNCYLESLELDEEFGTTMMIAESLMGMATVSGWLKLHKQAAGYNLQCLDLISSLDSTEIRNNLQLAVYNNLGYDHMGLNAYETANSYFKKVLSFSRAIGVDYYIPAAYRNLGEVYVKGFNQPDSALKYYDLAISLANQRNDIRVLTESYLGKSVIFMEKGSNSSGKAMLDSAAYYNSQFGSFEVDMMILKSYHDYYLEETNYKVANDYLEKYIELIDSNHKKEHSIALAEYEILFKNIQKEHQLEQMQKETEILRLGRRVIIAVSIAIFCLLLLTGYLLYSRYRKVKKRQTVLKEELSSKERELTSNALSLIKRNEAMKGVSSKLKDSKHKLKAENQKIVQEVINEINIELSEVGWKEFELRFLKVHPDFYPNIRKEFPDITPAEIKLSALLRLNFTTKEIASITGLSNSSVETARVRLRKKLELDSDTNLVSFLSRF